MTNQSRLNLPAKKLLINEMLHAVRTADDSSSIPDLNVWKRQGGNSKSNFSIVWLQGTVIKVTATEFLLDDETGTAQIALTNTLPSGCKAPSLGQYTLVIGELISADDKPVVRAMKVQDLSDQSLLRSIWPLEVTDARQFDL